MHKLTLLPELRWTLALAAEKRRGEEATLFAILASIADTGSLAQAANACGCSYRHAWGLIRTWETHFQQPLVDMARGRGSALAPLGLCLLRIEARVKSRFAAPLAAAAQEIERELAPYLAEQSTPLVLHASHDPLLSRLPEALRTRGVTLDLHVLGSSEALASFAAGRCDLAGFHCPQGALGQPLWTAYKTYLDPRLHVLIRFVRRSQGLMSAPGDPKHLRGVRDLIRADVRYINRQAGSGTRLLFDLLLAQERISPQDIAGYETEEFTHAAVAATIASGAADAGMGVEAAARRFDLNFTPLAREEYFFAIRRDALTQPTRKNFIATLASAGWRRTIAAEPGYEAFACGKVVECSAAWHSTRSQRALR
jgi:putative molybdopterin biosynthesis protein